MIIDTAALDGSGYVELDFFPGYAVITDPSTITYAAELLYSYDGIEVEVPEFQFSDPDGYFQVNDMYWDRGYMFVDLEGATDEDVVNYLYTLYGAGWVLEQTQSGYAAYSSDSGAVGAIEVMWDADYEVWELAFYTDYILKEITVETIVDMLSFYTGIDFEPDDEGGYGSPFGYGWPANQASVEYVMNFMDQIASLLTSYGFVLDADWTQDQIYTTPSIYGYYCTYYDVDSGVNVEFDVYSYSGYTLFEILVYEY